MTNRSLSVAHVVFGVIFLGIAALWAIATGTDASSGDIAALVPAVLIGSGVIGLAAIMLNARSARVAADAVAHDQDAAVPEHEAAAGDTTTVPDQKEQQ